MLDGSRMASLVTSKVCHDMLGPMSAMLQGLDMLRASDVGAKNAEALSLIEQSANKVWAKLDFFRNALAGGIDGDGEAGLDSVRETAVRLYSALKPTLEWDPPAVTMPRAALKVFLNLLFLAAECLPRGGTVSIEASSINGEGEVRIVAQGPRAGMRPETAAALSGQSPEGGFAATNVLPALTGLLARQAGLAYFARESGPDRIELVVRAASIRA